MTDYEIPDHARDERDEMESSDISENEVKVCLEIKQFVKG